MIQFIWDPEPQNTDHDHEIVCLGQHYSPLSKTQASTLPTPSNTAICSDGETLSNETQSSNNEKNIINDVATSKQESVDVATVAASSNTITAADTVSTSTPTTSSTNLDLQPLPPTEWPSDFLDDSGSRIWLTYRTSFPLIPKSRNGPSPVSIGGIFRGSGIDLNGFTSDVGWGCMIRTSQSLLANCLLLLELGRDWRRPNTPETLDPNEVRIISLFADDPACPFSIHNFVRHGEAACGKRPGEWFGPSAAASSIKALAQQYRSNKNNKVTTAEDKVEEEEQLPGRNKEKQLRVFISSGSDVYEKPFLQTAYDEKTKTFHPTLILLGLRLGIDKVNKVYWESVKAILECPHAVGIAGGRPSSSHYFYGYQGNNLFYLDPHFPKPALVPSKLTCEAIDTVHSKRIRLLNLSEMDPSMLVGVLIKNRNDWEEWKRHVKNSPQQAIIHISPHPVDLRRQSVSVSNDDDGEFIDVMLEPEEEEEGDALIEGDSKEIFLDSENTDAAATAKVAVTTQDEVIDETTHDRDTSGELLESNDEPVVVLPQSLDIPNTISSSVLISVEKIYNDDAKDLQSKEVRTPINSDTSSVFLRPKFQDSDYEYCRREEEPVVVVVKNNEGFPTISRDCTTKGGSNNNDDNDTNCGKEKRDDIDHDHVDNSFHDVGKEDVEAIQPTGTYQFTEKDEEGFQKLTVSLGRESIHEEADEVDIQSIDDTLTQSIVTAIAIKPTLATASVTTDSALASSPKDEKEVTAASTKTTMTTTTALAIPIPGGGPLIHSGMLGMDGTTNNTPKEGTYGGDFLEPSSHSSIEHVGIPTSYPSGVVMGAAVSSLSSTTSSEAVVLGPSSVSSSSIFIDDGYHKVFAPSSVTSTFSMSAYMVERPAVGEEEDDRGLVDVSNRSLLQQRPQGPVPMLSTSSSTVSISGLAQLSKNGMPGFQTVDSASVRRDGMRHGYDDWEYT